MSVEENKSIILHIWDECNRGNLNVLDECFADSFVRYAHDGTTMDKQGYKKFGTMVIKNIPDFHAVIDDILAEGEKIAFRLTITGTDHGKPFVQKETYFALIEDGKVVEYVNLNRRLD
jgi:predicted ester cyclase